MDMKKIYAMPLILLMISAAFAGCIGGDDSDDGDLTQATNGDESLPPEAGQRLAQPGDVDCYVFTTPNEDGTVIGNPIAGTDDFEMYVEPGFYTVNMYCLDINGNTGIEVVTTSEEAGDPVNRVPAMGIEVDPMDGCWIKQKEPPVMEWVQPCKIGKKTISRNSTEVEAIWLTVDVNTHAGQGTNTTITYSWTSGENTGVGTVTVIGAPTTIPSCEDRCISLWPGKVNQHNENGTWLTDPDGVSGGHLSTQYSTGYADRKVEYCQKWWPDTTSVELRTYRETISFYNAGNPEPPIPSTRDVFNCVVEEAQDSDGDGLSDWDEYNIYGTNASNPDTDGDGVSDGDEVNNGTNPLDPDCNAVPDANNRLDQSQEIAPIPDKCWSDTTQKDDFSFTLSGNEGDDFVTRTFIRYNGKTMMEDKHVRLDTTIVEKPFDPHKGDGPWEVLDTDGDGILDHEDEDDDGDGWTDADENLWGTDPLDWDNYPGSNYLFNGLVIYPCDNVPAWVMVYVEFNNFSWDVYGSADNIVPVYTGIGGGIYGYNVYGWSPCGKGLGMVVDPDFNDGTGTDDGDGDRNPIPWNDIAVSTTYYPGKSFEWPLSTMRLASNGSNDPVGYDSHQTSVCSLRDEAGGVYQQSHCPYMSAQQHAQGVDSSGDGIYSVLTIKTVRSTGQAQSPSVHYCPSDALTSGSHEGWPPGFTPTMAGTYPGPANSHLITILAETSTPDGHTPENNHLWSWNWANWDWQCVGASAGAN